ncbi:TIM-barrel domain-containing protein [Hanstruepera flava]|uniref:TIM-barrel domain-containing protein n=1 Tax=Hanstruepera flava TaxID=2930218 RepID=UPI002027FC2C|nr:TIM-barrel domain-containing protein [Hanstruepera flava]
MKQIKYILFFFLFQAVNAQVTFVIDELPEIHDAEKGIYTSGNFEGWSGGNESYKLQEKDGVYSITLPKAENLILFKFTQGSWDSVESDANGLSVENRTHNFEVPNDTVKVKIAGWTNNFKTETPSTTAKNVSVLSEDFQIPQLNRTRRVWVYLPPDYHSSKESYPVVYMHDGENLFDKKTSSFSNEWEVDETLNKLFKEKQLKLIVVGVDNGKDKRLDEYSPWVNEKYGGGEGDAYLEFLVYTLKPYIDSNYNTLKGKESTAIIGSSMGGLISHYAALKYPEVFGKIGVYSPAFWFAPQVNDFSQENANLQDTKMYFLAGGKEGENVRFDEISQTVKDMNHMVSVLTENGFPSENIKSKVVPEGKHNETLWRENFEETISWLFSEKLKERDFLSATITKNNELQIVVSDGKYITKFYSPKIVETTFLPNGEKHNPNSHAVVLNNTVKVVDFSEDDNQVIFKTEDFTVKVNKKPFNISYWYKGEKLTEEKNGYYKTDDFENLDFELTDDEILYGGGARALGMNRRGHRLQLYNKAHYGYETESELMNYTMPIAISSNQYMLHFDNAPIGYLDLDSNQDNTLTYQTISGRKTYQVIAGDSWFDLIHNYTDLTGKQPLPPRWVFGNFSSRFGYHSQKEVEETIGKFKEEAIPVDAVIIDIYWFGKDIQGHMGNLEFYRDSFPNPKQMIKELEDKGVKTVLVTEPFVLTTSKRWDDAVAKSVLAKDSVGNPARYDFYFGNTGLIDVYKPEGKKWFWNIYKELAEMGVKGIWGDLGEPEVHPTWVQHATGTADEVHNTYGHDWAKLVYEGYKNDFPNQRPFILMRSGSSGSQRFGLIPWSGDVNRTWGGLQSQTEIAMQMAMQGLAYMHSDLGGFAGANLDDELYTRWLQYGVFQPIYRPHAQEEVPSEPVFREEKTKQLAKQAIELRYRLLPYNYSLAFENNQKGTPFMRPLFFEEPENESQLVNAQTYFWGNDFLVTPIVNPEVTEKQAYFPKDNVWFDFYTDTKVEGGQTKTVATTISSIPTFVRAGAFIPMANLVQTTDDYNLNTFQLHYYHDASVTESERQVYNDDGLTPNAFEKGMFELLEFEAEMESNCLEIEFEAETGTNYSTNTKEVNLIVHNIEREPKNVKINGKKSQYDFNINTKQVTIPVSWNTAKEAEVKINFKN